MQLSEPEKQVFGNLKQLFPEGTPVLVHFSHKGEFGIALDVDSYVADFPGRVVGAVKPRPGSPVSNDCMSRPADHNEFTVEVEANGVRRQVPLFDPFGEPYITVIR